MTFKGIVYPKLSLHEVLASRLHWLFWLKHFVNVVSSRQIGVFSLPDSRPLDDATQAIWRHVKFLFGCFFHLSILPPCASIRNSLPLC